MPKIEEIQSYRNPFPTTDVIVEYNLNGVEGLVLVDRKNVPHGKALPGGFHDLGLSAGQNAAKEVLEETGLEVIIEDENHPFCTRSRPDRDIRGHMITVVYVARGYGTIKAGSDAMNAAHYSIADVRELIANNELAFDHGSIIEEYLGGLNERI